MNPARVPFRNEFPAFRRLCEKFHKGYISAAQMADNQQNPVGRGFGVGYSVVGAGFQLAFAILFFTGMGYLGDRKLGTAPWLMLLGLAVGLGAGFYAFWRRVVAASKANDQ